MDLPLTVRSVERSSFTLQLCDYRTPTLRLEMRNSQPPFGGAGAELESQV